MTIEAGIYGILSAYAGLTALVSTRIYPLVLPQDCDLPAVCYQLVSDVPEYILAKAVANQNARVQVNSYAITLDAAKSVAIQVKAAMVGYDGTIGSVAVRDITIANEQDLYESDLDIYNLTVDFMVIYV
jgi:hypothetical protein